MKVPVAVQFHPNQLILEHDRLVGACEDNPGGDRGRQNGDSCQCKPPNEHHANQAPVSLGTTMTFDDMHH